MDLLTGLLVLMAGGGLATYAYQSSREGQIYWKPRTLLRANNPLLFQLAILTYSVVAVGWAAFGVVLLMNPT